MVDSTTKLYLIGTKRSTNYLENLKKNYEKRGYK